ncbi:MAG TPA: glycosyltransferase family 39 protein, partial [Chloroflexota bacterium]
MSVVLSRRDPAELLALLISEDIHPPLYPLILHFWMLAAGSSEFAVRYLSLFAGVALVPLFYVTARRLERLAGESRLPGLSLLGLVAVVLSASSAFYVGYSQEARNYMLVTALGLLSSYLLLRALAGEGRRAWRLYAVAATSCVYANYTAFLLLVFHGIFVTIARRGHPGTRKSWLRAMAVTAVAYVPWVGFSVQQLTRINDYWPGTLKMGTAVRTTFAQLLAGGGADVPGAWTEAVAIVVLLLFGALVLLVGASRARTSERSLFLLLYLLVPSVILFAIAYSRPKFDPRYLLVATPAFYLVLASGMAWLLGSARSRLPLPLRGLLPLLGIACLLGVVFASTVYGEPTKTKADYRSLISFMERQAQPGDAVVVLMNAPHPYIYYGRSGLPWYPMERVDNFEDAITRLNKLAEEHRRLWFILWQQEWEDPADYVMHVMSDQATEVKLGANFAGLELRLFELSPNHDFTVFPVIQHPIEAYFGHDLEFWGWNSDKTVVTEKDNRTQIAAGEKLELDVHWIPLASLTSDVKTVVSLVDADRHVWARTDEVMANPLFPPTKWKVKDIIHDRHTLQVPPGTPPGQYYLEMTLYDPATLKPLDITTASGGGIGTQLPLGSIQVTPGPLASPGTGGRAPQFSWGSGPSLVELRSSAMGSLSALPGDQVEVSATWRFAQAPGADYSTRLRLVDPQGKIVSEQTVPMAARYPTSKWRASEEVTARYWMPVPIDLEKGSYWITVAPAGPASVPGESDAQVGHLDLLSAPATYELPPMQHTVGAMVGARAELAGFDLSTERAKPGDTISLTLYWRAVGAFDQSYKIFNHVIDDTNVFAGQRDSIPVNDS